VIAATAIPETSLQAAIGDCLAFDAFAFDEDGLGPSEVDVGRREIAQALVIAAWL
jgi:hypothetical protein